MSQTPDHQILVGPDQVKPSHANLKVLASFNPGVIEHDGKVVMLARVMEAHCANDFYADYVARRDNEPATILLPCSVEGTPGYDLRWEPKELGVDVLANDRYSVIVPGDVPTVRPVVMSHFRRVDVEADGEVTIADTPTFCAGEDYEEFGIEDPRITAMEGGIEAGGETWRYLISYVCCSGREGVAPGFAVTNDFETFVRLPAHYPQVVMASANKDVVVFPRRIHNIITGADDYFAMIRPGPAHRYTAPSMYLESSPDLLHWGLPERLLVPPPKAHVGGGCVPLETDEGWLVIYHRRTAEAKPRYVGEAILLGADNVYRLDKVSPQPILEPIQTPGEDVIGRVIFPTGIVQRGDELDIYSGYNDKYIGRTTLSLRAILDALVPADVDDIHRQEQILS